MDGALSPFHRPRLRPTGAWRRTDLNRRGNAVAPAESRRRAFSRAHLNARAAAPHRHPGAVYPHARAAHDHPHAKKQIADQLVIAEKTVDNHIQHIYDKINVSTRAGATLFAMEHDLL